MAHTALSTALTCADLSPHSSDVEAWSVLVDNSAYRAFNRSLTNKNFMLRMACEGNHVGFAKALVACAGPISMQHSLMVFAMVNDTKGAELICSHKRFIPPYDLCTRYAVSTGKADFLKWIVTHCPTSSYALNSYVGQVGTSDTLDSFRSSGMDIMPILLQSAILADNYPAIKWYIEGGYLATSSACINALQHGKLDVLLYLLENNAPLDSSDISFACNSTAAMLNGLAETEGVNMPPLDDELMCNSAVIFNNLDTLIWCIIRGYKWTENTYMAAFYVKNPASKDILNFLWMYGCPRPTEQVFKKHMCNSSVADHATWYADHFE